ncbi:hypothetical protein PFISCL1PPCAC_28178, partial [Pristionchus fissidentatus]
SGRSTVYFFTTRSMIAKSSDYEIVPRDMPVPNIFENAHINTIDVTDLNPSQSALVLSVLAKTTYKCIGMHKWQDEAEDHPIRLLTSLAVSKNFKKSE